MQARIERSSKHSKVYIYVYFLFLSYMWALEALLNAELQSIQSRRELISNQVLQFAGEEDHVVRLLGSATVYIRIVAERRDPLLRQTEEPDC